MQVAAMILLRVAMAAAVYFLLQGKEKYKEL